jgi:hypothetical protein
MKDWRGTEIVVGSLVVVIEKNRSFGKSGTHAAYGEVVRLGKKWPVVAITERVGVDLRSEPRAMDTDKVTVIGHVAPKAFGAVVPDPLKRRIDDEGTAFDASLQGFMSAYAAARAELAQ